MAPAFPACENEVMIPRAGRADIAIGPMTSRASWEWLGPHLGSSLAEQYTVRFFGSGGMPRSDIAVFVKQKPAAALNDARRYASRIVYMPVDLYYSRAEVEADANFLSTSAGLFVHSANLAAELAPHQPRIWMIDHPNRFGLAEPLPFRPSGYLLWLGDFLNLPYLLRWREGIDLPFELKILTNARRTTLRGIAMTVARARQLGVRLEVRKDRVNGLAMYEWDVRRQRDMMAEAKAAVDIKGGPEDFHQFTKPPTKAQQFIVSGIPFAANADSAAVSDLRARGFELADANDQSRWLSFEYWKETRDFGTVLARSLSPDAVARTYRRSIEEVLESAPTAATAHVRRPSPIPGVGLARPSPRQSKDYVDALGIIRRLGDAWRGAAPYSIRTLAELLRVYTPCYVTCRSSTGSAPAAPDSVSLLLDAPSDASRGKAPEHPAKLPDGWQLVVFGAGGECSRSGTPFVALKRWPRRGVLWDRTLAAAHACGEYLIFVPDLESGTVGWATAALAELRANTSAALVVRSGEAESGTAGCCAIAVRRSVWSALRGYASRRLKNAPGTAHADLQHRIRMLGFDVVALPDRRNWPGAGGHPRSSGAGEIAVYSAIAGGKTRLRAQESRCVGRARQIAFLDKATRAIAGSAAGWEIRAMSEDETDPNRRAKIHKIRPDLFLPGTEYSLWIDGNVSLIAPFGVERLIELYLAGTDIAVFRHHARSCIFEEAQACKLRRLDRAEVIDAQVQRYREAGFPPRYGLHELTVILRRHTPAVKRFGELWWEEIRRGSRRDQLSFDYVRWQTGIGITEFPLSVQEANGLFVKSERIRWWPPRLAAGGLWRRALTRLEGLHFGAAAPHERASTRVTLLR